ncbi:MAG TPA: DUF2993 domain-containing protein [Acidimicrobiales bacterium]|nr:DUF2993 domain-containing protein [Acidimicrobiales bacterium]
MIRRLFAPCAVIVLLIAADLTARGAVSSMVTTRARQEAPPGSSVTATVGGFPFVPPLLLSGKVKRASVHVTNLKAEVVVFASIDVDLTGVQLDRGRLLHQHKARITKIDHGTVRAVLTQQALSDALHGVKVEMANGQLTLAGIDVTPALHNNHLTVGGFTVPLSDYLPCVGAFTIGDGQMEMTCAIDNVPPALLDAVNNAASLPASPVSSTETRASAA